MATTTTAELAEAARRKGQRDERHRLYMFELCECCPSPGFCVAKVGIGIPIEGGKGKPKWTDKWECYVTASEIEALQASGWAATAAPAPERQPALF